MKRFLPLLCLTLLLSLLIGCGTPPASSLSASASESASASASVSQSESASASESASSSQSSSSASESESSSQSASSAPESASSSQSASSVPESASSSQSVSSAPESSSSSQSAASLQNTATEENYVAPEAYDGINTRAYPSVCDELVDLINQARVDEGLPALRHNDDLDLPSVIRAKEQPQSQGHTRPDGRKWSTVFGDVALKYFTRMGENLAHINFHGNDEDWQLVLWHENGWMHSEGHRANILNESYTDIGIGIYKDGEGTYHICTLFAAR